MEVLDFEGPPDEYLEELRGAGVRQSDKLRDLLPRLRRPGRRYELDLSPQVTQKNIFHAKMVVWDHKKRLFRGKVVFSVFGESFDTPFALDLDTALSDLSEPFSSQVPI